MSRWRIMLLPVLLLAACAEPKTPCWRVDGSCLDLTLGGTGTVDEVEFTATVKAADPVSEPAIELGGLKGGMPCELPCRIEIRPPPGVASSRIDQLSFDVIRGGAVIRSESLPRFSWPDGTYQRAAYYLGDVP